MALPQFLDTMSKSHKKPLTCLIILLSLYHSSSRDTLTPTQYLSDGGILISSGGTFALGFFTPANSSNNNRYIGIWYNKIPGRAVIWVANRLHPIYGTTGTLSITPNGSLLVSNGNSTDIWLFASTTQVPNPRAQLLDTGNFIVADRSDPNSIAWQSFDYPTDTLVPGMKLGWDLKSGLNRNLTAWSSPTDPSPGIYTFAVDLHGDPQVIYWAGSVREWRSGPWNGIIPYNDPNSVITFSFIFVKNEEEVSYTVDVVNNSTLTRLVVNSFGIGQRFVLLDSGRWAEYWRLPETRCDSFNVCGPYGVCHIGASLLCGCLPGFKPKSPYLWSMGDYSGGCIRKNALDCRNRTDGFVKVQKTVLPDTVKATVERRMSLDECRAECLRNCSCNGFASDDIHGNGCIIWFTDLLDVEMYSTGGQEFYLRLAAADIGSVLSQSNKREDTTVVVVLSVVLGTLLLASTLCYAWRKKKWHGGNCSIHDENIEESARKDNMELPLFDFEIINTATNNFSVENMVGEGGFGPVYKGKMRGGQEIAVKRLSKTSFQGLDELKTEVMLTAKLQHRNLVRLLGCCIQGDERMLIYEYMPNKSLDAFLFDEEKVISLDWGRRYMIILGIARGLLYLHQDSRFRIIHRDLKSSNILLDKDMNPKISDFGVARTFKGDETRIKTRRIVGTYGYMAPEYALNGIFSAKSDVFSFGVLILEIISGKRNKGVYFSQMEEYLIGEAWTCWKASNVLQLVDASLDCSLFMSEVLRCIKVGLLCIQDCPEDRPTMSSVILMLSSDDVFLPEPKQPGFVVTENSLNEHAYSNKKKSHTVSHIVVRENFLNEHAYSKKEKSHTVNDVNITESIDGQ